MAARILSAGVAVMDIIMQVDEMPRRADKYRTNQAMIVGGGCAANAAVAIARLGGDSALVSRLGKDMIGDSIVRELQGEGVNCDRMLQYDGFRSSFSSVYIDQQGERQIVNFRDDDLPNEASSLIDQGDSYDAYLADTRWSEGAVALMETANRLNKPAILDAEAPFDKLDKAFEQASYIFFSGPGLREYSQAENLIGGLREADQRLNGIVGVTDGAEGVYWIVDGQLYHLPATPVIVVDTLAAGDVWHGAFALALGENKRLDDAITFASAAASLKCTRLGGREGIPTREETRQFLNANHFDITRLGSEQG